MQPTLLEVLRCPACSARLEPEGDSLACGACRSRYDVVDGIPRMLHDESPGIAAKRREIDGWVALARAQEWYEPDDEVDAVLPFVTRDLGWEDKTWRANEHSFSILLEQYVQPGMRVLEVGAAKCWGAQHLVPLGCDYVGTDILADANIGLGRGAFYEQRVGPFARVQADGERLPFADASFDLVYCVAALHHALDLRAMVREMARVARRGGIVAALNEGTRPLASGGDNPEQNVEKEFGINEHVHTLPAYLWAFVRARLMPLRLERSEGYEAFSHRPKHQRVFAMPGGKTAFTLAYSLLKGYAGTSIYARRPVTAAARASMRRRSGR